MNRKKAVLLVVVSIPFLLGLSMSTHGVPKTLRYSHSDDLAWVSESEAFDSSGNLRSELFGPSAEPLRINLAANSDGKCHAFMVQPASERPLTDASLAEASAFARAIIVGQVVNSSRGFYHALPGTLVGVEVRKIFSASENNRDLVYLFIPSATFVTPAGALCSRSFGKVAVPESADTLIAFSYEPPNDQGGLILPIDPDRDLIVQRKAVRVHTPRQLESDLAGLQLDEIAQRIERHTTTDRRKR